MHALTRETAYGDLRPGRRATWHAQVGDALRSRLGRDPDLVTEVAYHYSRAASLLPDVVERAVEHGRSAAQVAERRGAFEEAAACGPARSTWSAGPLSRTPDVDTPCCWARRRPGSGSVTSAERRPPSTRRWPWPARSATTA